MKPLPSRVRKRSGREESFDSVRLADSVRAALQTALSHEAPVAALADAVEAALGGLERTVQTAEIALAVEKVLAGTGWVEAAAAFRLFRDEREKQLARIRVHTAHGREDSARPWERGRLALSLMRDRYLESELAWQIARRVERRVLDAGLRHVTGRLVASFADNECRTLGLRGDPLRGDRIGLDRREMRAWLDGDCLPHSGDRAPTLGPSGRDPRPALGAEVLARFAIEEVLSGAQADAWSEGRFDVPALGDWLRPARTLLRPEAGESEEAYWNRVSEARHRTREVQVAWPAARESTALSRRAPDWLAAPGCRLRMSSADVELALDWSLAGHWVRVPLGAFLGAPAQSQAALADTGRVLVFWHPHGRRERVRGEEVLDSFACLNLPRAAREAGDEHGFREAIEEATERACGALRVLLRRSRGEQSGAAIALLPVGLPEALSLLFPGENPAADRVRRTLLGLRECFARRARGAGMRLVEGFAPHPDGAGARLAARDSAPSVSAYTVGWTPSHGAPVPPNVAFDTAPWLEFAAEAARTARGLARFAAASSSSEHG